MKDIDNMDRVKELNVQVERMKEKIDAVKRCPLIPHRQKQEKILELTGSLNDVQAAAAMYMAIELEWELATRYTRK